METTVAINDKLQSAELNGNGKPMAIDGWYKHKETGAVVELRKTPRVGTPMIDAFIQTGFVYVGETDPRIEVAEPISEKIDETEVVSKTNKK